MSSTQISELNRVRNFEATAVANAADQKFILLPGYKKVYLCNLSLPHKNRSEERQDMIRSTD